MPDRQANMVLDSLIEVLSLVPTSVLMLVLVLLAALIAAGALMVQHLTGPRARLKRRIGAITGQGDKARPLAAGPRKRNVAAKLKAVEETRQSTSRTGRLRQALIHAGLTITPARFVVMSIAAGLSLTALWWLARLPALGLPLILVSGLLGLPKLTLSILINRRRASFNALFADGLDIIIRGVRSGLPLGECLIIVGREMPDPVGEEFRLITEGVRLGLTLDECLARTVDRMPTPEFRFFSIVLSIQQTTGGNLAETLSKLADVLRSRKKMRDKAQAMSSEAKASAGIIGSLPIAVGSLLAVIAPQYIGLLFTTNAGNLMLAGGGLMMFMGALVMRRMIHFDM
ncbi:type II secretion system F family protein [Magnetospirillum moscoviense]|uniref:type II secretion system F family protein n=1 Tax=Magnetospirillum moscoviense TaxID=1437059 RepID=UPI000A917A18|nr:type II secretion system F family protein [Magnetospirillum moscoviense]